MTATLLVGESLVGEGNEVAHVDLLIGSKSGPVGEAFANSLVNQKEGHTNLLAVVAPNLPAKPDTIMSNKVTMKGATQAVQMFGPAQAAVARAVVDSVREGFADRPALRTDQEVDMCDLVALADERLSNQQRRSHDPSFLWLNACLRNQGTGRRL